MKTLIIYAFISAFFTLYCAAFQKSGFSILNTTIFKWNVRLTYLKFYWFGWYKEDILNHETNAVLIPKGKFWISRYWFWHFSSAKSITAYTIRILGFNLYISEPNAREKLLNIHNKTN